MITIETKNWYKANASPDIVSRGIYVDKKSVLYFRPKGDVNYLVKMGSDMIELSKVHFLRLIYPIKKDGNWLAVRKEVSDSIEEGIQRVIEREVERKRLVKIERDKRKAYEALSEGEKKNHNRMEEARKLVENLKTKKDKIIALHKLKCYDRKTIQEIVDADYSYMEEVYTKHINGVVIN